jgi:hypothetical protein
MRQMACGIRLSRGRRVVQIVRGLLAAMYVSVITIPSARSPIPAATKLSAVQYYRAGR